MTTWYAQNGGGDFMQGVLWNDDVGGGGTSQGPGGFPLLDGDVYDLNGFTDISISAPVQADITIQDNPGTSGGLTASTIDATPPIIGANGGTMQINVLVNLAVDLRVACLRSSGGVVFNGGFTNGADLIFAQVGSSVANSNVRFGVANGGGTGTLVVPSASSVKKGVTFDNGTVGTFAGGTRRVCQ
jgi:hypothetical protein